MNENYVVPKTHAGKNGYSSSKDDNRTTLEKLKEYKENFNGESGFNYLSFKKQSLMYHKDGRKFKRNGRHLHKTTRIRVDTYFYDFEIYRLGVFCIKHNKKRGEFVKEAVLEKMARVRAEHKLQREQMKRGSLV